MEREREINNCFFCGKVARPYEHIEFSTRFRTIKLACCNLTVSSSRQYHSKDMETGCKMFDEIVDKWNLVQSAIKAHPKGNDDEKR